MKRSVDEKFRRLPAVLGISVAQLAFVEAADAIFWTGHPQHRYHYKSTRQLIYYTQHTPINTLYDPWFCFCGRGALQLVKWRGRQHIAPENVP